MLLVCLSLYGLGISKASEPKYLILKQRVEKNVPDSIKSYVTLWNESEDEQFFLKTKDLYRGYTGLPNALMVRYLKYKYVVDSVYKTGENYTVTFKLKYRDEMLPEKLREIQKNDNVDPRATIYERFVIKDGKLAEIVSWEYMSGAKEVHGDLAFSNLKEYKAQLKMRRKREKSKLISHFGFGVELK